MNMSHYSRNCPGSNLCPGWTWPTDRAIWAQAASLPMRPVLPSMTATAPWNISGSTACALPIWPQPWRNGPSICTDLTTDTPGPTASIPPALHVWWRQPAAAGLLHDLAKTYCIRHGGSHAQLGAAWVLEATGQLPHRSGHLPACRMAVGLSGQRLLTGTVCDLRRPPGQTRHLCHRA